MSRKRQVDFEAFLADHPVFALRELAAARGAPGAETAARNQLKHHLRSGRVRQVARGIYAAVPPGIDPRAFQPDRDLVAAAAKPDGVFAYHAALELHGVAQSVWQECALHCERPRTAIAVGGVEIVFLPVPQPLRREKAQALGVGTIVHGARRLRVTGPERTLVEGFRQPHRVGGLLELLESAPGFAVLDFALLEKVLAAYDQRSLWAAVGWFVESNRERWLPPEQFLARCRRNRPRSMQYLLRDRRGGTGLSEWNLVLPPELVALRFKVKLPSQEAFQEALQAVEGRVSLYGLSKKRRTLSMGSLPPDVERRVLALGGAVTAEERYDLETAGA